MSKSNGARLAALRRRFDAWRQKGVRRFPPELWQAAAAAAKRHGLSQTARELGVGYYSLQRHLEGAPAAAPPGDVEFVELPRKVFAPSTGGVLELHDPRGHRLRLELPDPAALERFARTLWSLRG
jgi:hypothetical protein